MNMTCGQYLAASFKVNWEEPITKDRKGGYMLHGIRGTQYLKHHGHTVQDHSAQKSWEDASRTLGDNNPSANMNDGIVSEGLVSVWCSTAGSNEFEPRIQQITCTRHWESNKQLPIHGHLVSKAGDPGNNHPAPEVDYCGVANVN